MNHKYLGTNFICYSKFHLDCYIFPLNNCYCAFCANICLWAGPGGNKFRVFPLKKGQENGLDWWLTLGPPNLWECRSPTALSLQDHFLSISLSLLCVRLLLSPSHPPCPQSRPSVMKVAQPSWAPHQEMPNLSKYIHWNYIYCHDGQALNTDLCKEYLLRELFKNMFIYRQKNVLMKQWSYFYRTYQPRSRAAHLQFYFQR